jgi:hypothetical protein
LPIVTLATNRGAAQAGPLDNEALIDEALIDEALITNRVAPHTH